MSIFESALRFCDVVLPSFDDMRLIYPGLNPAAVATRLRQHGAGRVILKLGRHGCLVVNQNGSFRLPSVATKIIDTTGAGDCFNAGFIAGLVKGLGDVDAAKLGGLTAAACVRNVGGAVGIPRHEALVKKIKRVPHRSGVSAAAIPTL